MPPNPFLAPKPRPLVVGHRGVPQLHQENSLAGFRRAAALGVPAVELDVRLTADRRAVCVHDVNLERLTGTAANVTDLTWDQLRKLRLRAELPMGIAADGRAVTVRYERPEPIPLLAEVLAEVGGQLAINVELKLARPFWVTEVGAITADEIARARVQDRVIVTSFDPLKLRAAARAHPGVTVGFAYDDTMLDFAAPVLDRLPPLAPPLPDADPRPHANGRRLLGRILEAGVVGRFLDSPVVCADHTLLEPRTVAHLRRRGGAIGAYTLYPLGSTTAKRIPPRASDPAEVERLIQLGVDWIETDDPERLLRQVHAAS